MIADDTPRDELICMLVQELVKLGIMRTVKYAMSVDHNSDPFDSIDDINKLISDGIEKDMEALRRQDQREMRAIGEITRGLTMAAVLAKMGRMDVMGIFLGVENVIGRLEEMEQKRSKPKSKAP